MNAAVTFGGIGRITPPDDNHWWYTQKFLKHRQIRSSGRSFDVDLCFADVWGDTFFFCIHAFHRTHESRLVWRISFTLRNTITEDKLTNTFEVGDKMTRDAPTARRGFGALPKSHLGLYVTLVCPGKDTHGTPVPLRSRAVGGHNTETTRPRLHRHAFVSSMFV